jgi:hypothetical protein
MREDINVKATNDSSTNNQFKLKPGEQILAWKKKES